MNVSIPASGFLFAIATMAIDAANKASDIPTKGAYFIVGGVIYVVTFYLVKEGIITSLKAVLGK